jgi:preprotein translocase subunit SecA
MHKQGRPVLIGTRSVEASEHLSGLLAQKGLSHQLLNARQDAGEARVIAQAGKAGRITVATNMAGRGTDIKLEASVEEMGGLHVIATELHEARRIDRQLFGRCGRQGDRGTCEAILSLEDDLARVYSHGVWKTLDPILAKRRSRLYSRIRTLSLKRAQFSAERLHGRIRQDLLKTDESLQTTLAFSGRSE